MEIQTMTVACGEWFYVGILEDGHLTGGPDNKWKTINSEHSLTTDYEEMTFTQVDACVRGFIALSSSGEALISHVYLEQLVVPPSGTTIIQVAITNEEILMLLDTGKVLYRGGRKFGSSFKGLTNVIYISASDDILSVITADGNLHILLPWLAHPISIPNPEEGFLIQVSATRVGHNSIEALGVDSDGNRVSYKVVFNYRIVFNDKPEIEKYVFNTEHKYQKCQINKINSWGLTTDGDLWRLDDNTMLYESVADFSLSDNKESVILFGDGRLTYFRSNGNNTQDGKKFMVRIKGLIKSAMKTQL